MAERITVIIDAESKGLAAEAAKAVAAIGAVDAAAKNASKSQGSLWQDAEGKWRNSAGQYASGAEKAAAGLREMDSAARSARGGSDDLNVSVRELDSTVSKVNRSFTFTRNTLGALKLPAYAAGAGMLAEALVGVAGGLTAIGAAGVPALGVLGAIPEVASAAAQAVGTIKLASFGVSAALKAQSAAHAQAGQAAQSSAAQQASAADTVHSAKERLADADRAEHAAQVQLTAAYAEARLELKQLEQAATQTALDQRQAEITLREAIERRRQLNATPGASLLDTDQANLDVDTARQQLKTLQSQGHDQQSQIDRTKARGTNRSDVVVKARQQEAAADRDVADAAHELAQAQQAAADASDKLSSGQERLQTAMDALPASAQEFVKFLGQQQDKLTELRKTAADGIFPGLESGITSAEKNFGILDGAVGKTSGVLGDIADQVGKFLGSKGFGRDFKSITDENAVVLKRGGEAGINLAHALVDVMVAAEPLVDWLSRISVKLSAGIEDWAETGRKTGQTKDFFDQTRQVLEVLGGITGDVATGIKNIWVAAYPVGRDLLDLIHQVTSRWAVWTDSLAGQNELQGYFKRSEPVLIATGKLVGAIVDAFFDMSNQPGTSGLIDQIRTQLLPAVEQIMQNLTGPHGFGPALVGTVTSIVQLIAALSANGGGLTLAVKAIGDVVDGVKWLLENIPGLGPVITVALAGATLYKVLGIGKAISGIQTLITLLARVKAPAAAAGAAGDVIAGAPIPVIGTGPRAVAAREAAQAGRAGVSIAEGAGGGAAATGAAAGARGIVGLAAGAGAGAGLGALGGVLYALIATQPKLDKLTQSFDQLINAPRGSERFDQLAQLQDKLEKAVKAGDPGQLRAIAQQIDAIGKATGGINAGAFGDLADQVRTFADAAGWTKLKGEVTSSAKEFDLWAAQGGDAMKGIANAVSINTQRISSDLGQKTDAGRAALAANFRMAAAAIKTEMGKGAVSTKDGLEQIQKYMADALKLYGFSSSEAKHLAANNGALAGQGNEGGAQQAMKAGGGWIGQPGDRGQDDIPIWVGSGEAVLNANQQSYADLGLQVAHSMGYSPYGSLDSLFRGETSPHYMAFASGGRVSTGAMTAAANKIEGAHFPYRWGGGHEASPAPFGPFDCSGAVSFVLQQGGVQIPTEVSGQLVKAGKPGPGAVTIFANSEHTFMRLNGRYFGTSESNPGGGAGWFDAPSPSYLSRFTVRHIDTDGGAFGTGAAIATPKSGLPGALGQVVQGGLGAAAAAANIALTRISGTGGGDAADTSIGATGADASVVAAFKRAIQAKSATAVEGLSLGEAGVVESGMKNLNYGDRDSLGALQQRPSQGWKHPRIPFLAAEDFLEQAIAKRPWKGSAGQLAQAMQRSAFPGRYDAASPAARALGFARGGRVRRAAAGRPSTRKPAKRIPLKGSPPARPLKGVLRGDAIAAELVPGLTRAGGWQGMADDANTTYGLLVRQDSRTDEQSTISGPVSGFSDDQLLTVYAQTDLPQLRAQPTLQVDVVDTAGIAQHVSELQGERAAKQRVRDLVAAQTASMADALRELNAGIAARQKALKSLQDKLAANIKRINTLKTRLTARRRDIDRITAKINRGGASASEKTTLRKQLADARSDVSGYQREIDKLQGDDTSISSRIDAGQTDLTTWTSAQQAAAPTLHGLQTSDLPSLGVDLGEIDDQIRAWGATPQITKADLTAATSANDAARADLLQQMLDESRHANFLQGQQLTALASFQPLLEGRLIGSFAHGIRRVGQGGIAELHRDEQVITDPEGPYGSQIPRRGSGGAGGDIHLWLDGDMASVLAKARASTDDGRTARVTSQRIGQRTRLQFAAPGRG